MGYKKCPRCELNYIRDDQQLCDVCSRKRKASDDDNEVLMCIECGENPAMKGKELCAACYKESLRQERLEAVAYGDIIGNDSETEADSNPSAPAAETISASEKTPV